MSTYEMVFEEMSDRAPKLTIEERTIAIYSFKENVPDMYTDTEFMCMPDSLLYIISDYAKACKLNTETERMI